MNQVADTALAVEPGTNGATETLASFAATLKFDDLPDDVIEKTKLLIRDGIANQLGASTIAEPARIAHELVAEFGGAEQATVTGYGTRLPVPFAAMINAMLGHGVELDDAHGRALTKSGSLLVPTIMTTGEFRGCSGSDTIVSAVIGYELMVRIGLAVNPSHRTRGFHTTGAVGAIASAGAAAKQLGLDETGIADAIGLGAMQAAGIQAYLDYPCMAKPLSPGKAAFNGTLAAMLVLKGFTGPRHGLESREGFFNAYADGIDAAQLYQGIGSEFKVMEVGFKPHAACRFAHGPIDAAQEIRRTHSVEPHNITAITVRMSELAIRQSGRTDAPNLNAAMGSTPFGIALALVQGRNGLGDYDLGFKDDQVHQLAQSVEVVADPSYGMMGRQAALEVRLRNGQLLKSAVEGPKGEPENPMTRQELDDKFLGLAGLAVSEEAARKISDLLMDLEHLDDIRQVIRLLAK